MNIKIQFENKRDNQCSMPSSNVNRSSLRADCGNCFGLCCVALYFSASEGFPIDKDAGTPCINLQSDFRCRVHENLRENGLKGCVAYDCFGAGAKVAQVTYSGHDWLQAPESAKQMFEVFLIMRQLHEMLWYLTETLTLKPAHLLYDKLHTILGETECLTHLSSDELIKLDVTTHRSEVNALLLQTSELVRAEASRGYMANLKHRKTLGKSKDLIDSDLRKTNLKGADLRGALLIAANLKGADLSGADFIGADLREADFCGANLAESIFLTQAQINVANGDANTKLSPSLIRPSHWSSV